MDTYLCYSENRTNTQTDSVFKIKASIILKRMVLVRAQGYANPGRQAAVATEFVRWRLLFMTLRVERSSYHLLAPRILRWLLDF